MSNPNPRTDQLRSPQSLAKRSATMAGKHRKPSRAAAGFQKSAQPHGLVQHAIRFPPKLYEAVCSIAAQLGMSVSETVVHFVDLTLEERGR